MVRGESHIDFRKQSGGGGVITNDVLKFKKKFRISKLVSCHELPMNCVLVYYEGSVRALL